MGEGPPEGPPSERQRHVTKKREPVQRAKAGSGSFKWQESRGLWVGRVTLPPDPRTGAPRRRSVTGVDEAETRRRFDALLATLATTGNLSTRNPTLAVYLTHWLSTLTVKPRTLSSYRSNCALYLIPAIGKVKLSQLDADDVRKMTRAVTKRGLSSTTARGAQAVLTIALNAAVAERVITWNPAAVVQRPKKAVVTEAFLSVEQTQRLLDSASGDRLYARIMLACLTGCRQGEALALTTDRLDFTPGSETADLSWQLQRLTWSHAEGCVDAKTRKPACGGSRGADCPRRFIEVPAGFEYEVLNGALIRSRPKTAAGNRRIPLTEPLLSALRDRHAVALAEPNPLGLMFTQPPHTRLNPGDRFFDGGAPIQPTADNKAWHGALVAAGLEEEGVPVYALHSCRHSAISVMSALRIDQATRMKVTGHSSVSAHDGYDHNDDLAPAREALAAMGSLFTPRPIAPSDQPDA
jgi:integrase